MPSIVLASSSIYRRQLLDKLGLDYIWRAPDIDESPLSEELPKDLVMRLAEQKALALAEEYPAHLIIGSDQVAVINGKILGKPGSIDRAREQLMVASGNTMTFLTGLCLLHSSSGSRQTSCETYSVTFRELSAAQIEMYLLKEKPFDCAGSFKAEGLGICLFSKLTGNDPNTLIGLPLIALVSMLHNEGIQVPS